MIATVVSVVAFAGAAMAGCPLAVEIVGATNHIAQVSVTNTGSDTVTVFKGNTVLSDHATKDLVVSDAGMIRSPIITILPKANTLPSRQDYPVRGCLHQLQA
jgi:hypothetical protein